MDSPNHNPRWPLETAVLAAGIPPIGKLVMLTLLARTPRDSLDLGKWSPGIRRLAEQTGLKPHTVIKYLDLLAEHGWLAVRKQQGLRTRYVLSTGQAFQAVAPRKPPTVAVKGNSPNGGVAMDGNGGVAMDGNTYRSSVRRTDKWSDREPDPSLAGDWRDDLRIGS